MNEAMRQAKVSGRPRQLAAAGLLEERQPGLYYPPEGYVLIRPDGKLIRFVVERDGTTFTNTAEYIYEDNRPLEVFIFRPESDRTELAMIRDRIRSA